MAFNYRVYQSDRVLVVLLLRFGATSRLLDSLHSNVISFPSLLYPSFIPSLFHLVFPLFSHSLYTTLFLLILSLHPYPFPSHHAFPSPPSRIPSSIFPHPFLLFPLHDVVPVSTLFSAIQSSLSSITILLSNPFFLFIYFIIRVPMRFHTQTVG